MVSSTILMEFSFLITVSSYRSCPHTDSQLFASKVREALREMKDVLAADTDAASTL